MPYNFGRKLLSKSFILQETESNLQFIMQVIQCTRYHSKSTLVHLTIFPCSTLDNIIYHIIFNSNSHSLVINPNTSSIKFATISILLNELLTLATNSFEAPVGQLNWLQTKAVEQAPP